MKALQPDLKRRLREAGAEALEALVEEHMLSLGEAEVGQILANPQAGREVLERLAGERRLSGQYRVRARLARHPHLPQALAMRWVPTLFWRELMDMGLDPRLSPLVRRSAERHLAERLPGMALGEKVSLARRAGPGVLAQLRFDPSPRVIAALLDNPRTTEGTLMPLVSRRSAPPEVLRRLASSRWGRRPTLRRALARNPATPPELALQLLPGLRRTDLAALAADPGVPALVRGRAKALLGERPTPGSESADQSYDLPMG